MIQVMQLFPCKIISGPPPLKLRYDLEFDENHTGTTTHAQEKETRAWMEFCLQEKI